MSTNIQNLAHDLVRECGVIGALLALRHECRARAQRCRPDEERSRWEKYEAVLEQAQEMARNSNARLLFPDEAAARLRLDEVGQDPERTVLQMVKRGELEGRLVGRRRLIVASSVDRFIERGQGKRATSAIAGRGA